MTDREGRSYTARLHGTLIADDEGGDTGIQVYLAQNGLVYVYDGRQDGELLEDVDTEDLRNWLNDSEYIDAMTALGRDAVVDIGLPE